MSAGGGRNICAAFSMMRATIVDLPEEEGPAIIMPPGIFIFRSISSYSSMLRNVSGITSIAKWNTIKVRVKETLIICAPQSLAPSVCDDPPLCTTRQQLFGWYSYNSLVPDGVDHILGSIG